MKSHDSLAKFSLLQTFKKCKPVPAMYNRERNQVGTLDVDLGDCCSVMALYNRGALGKTLGMMGNFQHKRSWNGDSWNADFVGR